MTHTYTNIKGLAIILEPHGDQVTIDKRFGYATEGVKTPDKVNALNSRQMCGQMDCAEGLVQNRKGLAGFLTGVLAGVGGSSALCG